VRDTAVISGAADGRLLEDARVRAESRHRPVITIPCACGKNTPRPMNARLEISQWNQWRTNQEIATAAM
jgi:hypothetical protein